MADQPTNVFEGEQTPTTPATATPTPNAYEDLLKNIKNENGEQKYKSLEDALVALGHSQNYIPELKSQLTGTQTQLEEMKAEMAKFGNIEETVQRLLADKPTTEVTTPEAKGLDEQAVLKLVQNSLEQRKQTELLSANQQKVNDALLGKFGEKAVEALDAKAAELKTTRQALGELSKQNPDLVLALFNSSTNKEPNPTSSSRRSPSFNTDTGELAPPSKSMLGLTSVKDQAQRLAEIRDHVHKKYS